MGWRALIGFAMLDEPEKVVDTLGSTVVEGCKAYNEVALMRLQHQRVFVFNGQLFTTVLNVGSSEHDAGLIGTGFHLCLTHLDGTILQSEEPLSVFQLHRTGIAEAVAGMEEARVHHCGITLAIECIEQAAAHHQ